MLQLCIIQKCITSNNFAAKINTKRPYSRLISANVLFKNSKLLISINLQYLNCGSKISIYRIDLDVCPIIVQSAV